MLIILVIYMILGYWAAGKTIYANKVVIEYKPGSFFVRRCCVGMLLGVVLIPIAIIKTIVSR